jgi:hypothetical protein
MKEPGLDGRHCDKDCGIDRKCGDTKLVRCGRPTVRIFFAGLPYPIVVRNGKASAIQAGGMSLGLFEDAEYEELTLACDPGDLIVFYTDGVTEAVDLAGFWSGTP